jgi:pyruvate dehydrogenase (quinone)
MPRVLEIAIQTALAKRGVAVVVLPGDVALREATNSAPRLNFPEIHTTIRPSDEEIARTAGILNESRKVTIFGGCRMRGSPHRIDGAGGKLKAPIVHALRGKEFIEYDNPFDVGMTGLLGFSSGYRAMMDCDTLLMLGTDFPYQQFYPEKATIIQVDIRAEQIGRRTKTIAIATFPGAHRGLISRPHRPRASRCRISLRAFSGIATFGLSRVWFDAADAAFSLPVSN